MARSLKLSNDDYIDINSIDANAVSGTHIVSDCNTMSTNYGYLGGNSQHAPTSNMYGIIFRFGFNIHTQNGGWWFQCFFGTNGKIYTRYKINNGDWSAWREILTQSI